MIMFRLRIHGYLPSNLALLFFNVHLYQIKIFEALANFNFENAAEQMETTDVWRIICIYNI